MAELELYDCRSIRRVFHDHDPHVCLTCGFVLKQRRGWLTHERRGHRIMRLVCIHTEPIVEILEHNDRIRARLREADKAGDKQLQRELLAQYKHVWSSMFGGRPN